MANNKTPKSMIFKEGIVTNNPVFVSLLGLCPCLAISTSIDNAIGMTLALVLVLLLSNVTISLIRKIVPDEIRIPIFIIVVATFVSCVDMLMHAFTPALYDSLGIFIPLIVVNCLILGRAEAFASKNSVGDSAIDALGMGLGYGIALFIISFVRELISSQSLTLSNPFNTSQFVKLELIKEIKIPLFGESTGAFFALGVIIAVVVAIRNHNADKKAKKEAEERAKLTFSIDPEKCKKCGMCARNCPAKCISGEPGKVPYVIDQGKCQKCGACEANCKFGAVTKK